MFDKGIPLDYGVPVTFDFIFTISGHTQNTAKVVHTKNRGTNQFMVFLWLFSESESLKAQPRRNQQIKSGQPLSFD